MITISALLGVASLISCDTRSPAEPAPPAAIELVAAEVASGLSSPVYLTAPAGDARLFIVEQPGRIRILRDGALLPAPFLDLTSLVLSGGERGLLSMAFHPNYAANGEFFVSYTGAGGASRIERYRVSSDPDRADPASAGLVLSVAQPASNHNGGLVMFGPDGMLYVGLGDGGGAGDPLGNGQNLATLLGSILRIDVNAGDPYAIPSGNPFAGAPGARPEIWAYGLRNPWRFSFDRTAGLLFVADVGQNRREEINVIESGRAGANFGWNRMEGSLCFLPATGCSTAGLVLPVFEYDNPAQGCSVTGGFVYRGSAIPELRGHYFFGDFCRGTVRSFTVASGGMPAEHREWPLGSLGNIMSFGEDSAGELYVVVQQGRVYRLARGS